MKISSGQLLHDEMESATANHLLANYSWFSWKFSEVVDKNGEMSS